MLIDIYIMCRIYPRVLIYDNPRYINARPIPRLPNGIHPPIGYAPSRQRHSRKWLDLLYKNLPIWGTLCNQTGEPRRFWSQWRWGRGQKQPVLYESPGGGAPFGGCVGHPYPPPPQRIWRLPAGLPPPLQFLFQRTFGVEIRVTVVPWQYHDADHPHSVEGGMGGATNLTGLPWEQYISSDT